MHSVAGKLYNMQIQLLIVTSYGEEHIITDARSEISTEKLAFSWLAMMYVYT